MIESNKKKKFIKKSDKKLLLAPQMCYLEVHSLLVLEIF